MSEFMAHAAASAAGAFGKASGIFKTIKEGADAVHEAKNLELYERMLNVYGDVMELVEQNRELVERVRALEDQLKNKEQLAYDGERYWMNKEGKREGPFCGTCWDVDNRLVRMRSYQHPSKGLSYTCDYCVRKR